MTGIYKMTSPSGKVYIGQSRELNRRKNAYKNLNAKGQRKLENSLNKYGFDAHNFEIIELCEIEQLNNRERHYQDLFNSYGREGLNITLTRCDDKPQVLSEETKRKISESRKGIIISDEHKRKISLFHTGRKHTDEAKKKISDHAKGHSWNKGYKKPQWAIDNTIAFHTGRKRTEESKLKMRKAAENRGVPVIQMDLSGNYIATHASIMAASRSTKLQDSHISGCCRGKAKTHGGYKWKYA